MIFSGIFKLFRRHSQMMSYWWWHMIKIYFIWESMDRYQILMDSEICLMHIDPLIVETHTYTLCITNLISISSSCGWDWACMVLTSLSGGCGQWKSWATTHLQSHLQSTWHLSWVLSFSCCQSVHFFCWWYGSETERYKFKETIPDFAWWLTQGSMCQLVSRQWFTKGQFSVSL